ncbi:hypothetical protein N4T20_20610 [Flavobacterium sp. TR2]|uniref:hypothetical protein n=2 Tax=Flavobacterium TaxID=237 RepID=UPI0021B0CB96|nr:hypothetical protein [Flavobacterium sp. TR2]UWY28111.1 hypothetical protein N4T20_20610 [Flavobacterium sp. TR2]
MDFRKILVFIGFTFGLNNLKIKNMKKLAILFSLFFLVLGGSIEAQSGHYKGGKGSSHKGGKYKNSSTNNHYKKRK